MRASSVENIQTGKQNKRIEGTEKNAREISNICVIEVPGEKKENEQSHYVKRYWMRIFQK